MSTARLREMQDDLTRVGPGTTMGEFMRQYWIPAALSSEVHTDGDPIRLKLLGEQLIVWRDSAGVAGVMDHRCPHRNASLFLGRNEDGGIRCVYHGWKFAVDGTCLEQAIIDDLEKMRLATPEVATWFRTELCAAVSDRQPHWLNGRRSW